MNYIKSLSILLIIISFIIITSGAETINGTVTVVDNATARYDDNNDTIIQRNEAVNATNDYFHNIINIDDILKIIRAFQKI